MGMSRSDKQAWAAARTLDDLGGLMARWLTGDLRSWPGYQPNWGPDDETRELLPALVHANRVGFVTLGSQPGCDEQTRHGRWQQRAGVEGHVDNPRLLRSIRSAAARNGCEVIVDAQQVVVTTIDGRSHTGFGGRMRRGDYRVTWPGLSKDAYRAVTAAHLVAIVHPTWGPASTQPLIRTLTSLTA